MDTYEFMQSDWTQRLSEYDELYSTYGAKEEWDLWNENPEAKASKYCYSRPIQPSTFANSLKRVNIDQLIEDLRKPLVAMAIGNQPFDPDKFEKITNEIKFYEWAKSELESSNYLELFDTIYEEVNSTIARKPSLEAEKRKIEEQIISLEKKAAKIQKTIDEAERFKHGTRSIRKLKSGVARHLAILLILEFWRSNKQEIKERYLSLPAKAIAPAEFILNKFINYSADKISRLRIDKIIQDTNGETLQN